MRPDEHKKKKNTAYKKKHGINNKSSGDPGDKKSKHEKNKTNVKMSDQNTISSPRAIGATPCSIVDSSGTDTEIVEHKKSYRRRDVVSNWKKYELGPELDDGPVLSRGEDFNKLLHMTGETMSHFRFRDELDWEEDIKSGEMDSAEHGPGATSFLSLDLADISSAMACIPINQLLGIDESLFPVDQLKAHKKSVSEKRSIYLKTVSERLPPNRTEEQTKTNTCAVSKNVCHPSESSQSTQMVLLTPTPESKQIGLKNNMETGEVTANDHEISKLPVDTTICNRLSTLELKPDSVRGDQTSTVKVSNKHSHPDGSLSLQDDELDQLLDMDVVHKEKNGQALSQKNKSNNATSPSRENSKKNHLSSKDEAKEAEDLEDWLDSILD